jgi:protein-S-isoprenylcysteine O-methyltransferase Ste14
MTDMAAGGMTLARIEEREALAEFGPAYERYMQAVPAFFPRFVWREAGAAS